MKRLICAFFGHTNLDIIEEYTRIERREDTVILGRMLPPRIKATICGKFRCSRCKTVVTGSGLQYRWLCDS